MHRSQMVLVACAEICVVLVAATLGGSFFWLRTYRPNTRQTVETAKPQTINSSEQLERDREKLARTQIKETLTRAMQSYYVDHENYPVRLDDLLRMERGKRAYIENPQRLIDPWGHPYHYDLDGQNNQGMRPDIWSEGPHGPIGNWPTR